MSRVGLAEAPALPYTPPTMTVSHEPAASTPAVLDAIPGYVKELRTRFDSGVTRPRKWRVAQLDALAQFLTEREGEILEALHADLAKPELEAYAAEVSFCLNEIDDIKKHLKGWMKPEKVSTPLVTQPGTSMILPEPLGVVLVIAPWNYPMQLALAPAIAALAAGNTVMIKPSEVAPHTSALLAKWLPRYVDQSALRVVEGGIPETTRILEQRFDHIFYTGNGVVGRIVMTAAAKHLTPVTLELGGKSPTIVDRTADLDVTARRIVFGKFYNAGQTCVAPDYVLVEDQVHDALVHRIAATVRSFYGDDPQASSDYARIINGRHHARVLGLLEGAGTVVCGADHDASDRYIAPTVLKDVDPDAKIMQEEIFGPLLPILSVSDVDEAIAFVNARPKPLALYLFSKDARTQEKVLARTSSGGATLNHVWLHLAVPGLPFGGVGESGMGAYHGRHGFETFSHLKAVLKKPFMVDPDLLYPPYGESKSKWIKRIL